jgi:hypothetical protein
VDVSVQWDEPELPGGVAGAAVGDGWPWAGWRHSSRNPHPAAANLWPQFALRQQSLKRFFPGAQRAALAPAPAAAAAAVPTATPASTSQGGSEPVVVDLVSQDDDDDDDDDDNGDDDKHGMVGSAGTAAGGQAALRDGGATAAPPIKRPRVEAGGGARPAPVGGKVRGATGKGSGGSLLALGFVRTPAAPPPLHQAAAAGGVAAAVDAAAATSALESTREGSPYSDGGGIGGGGGGGGGSHTASAAGAWARMLTGPAPPPLCRCGIPAVHRTVKRKDKTANAGRTFWVCTKPEGKRGDPAARCDFFLWDRPAGGSGGGGGAAAER